MENFKFKLIIPFCEESFDLFDKLGCNYYKKLSYN